MDLPQLKIRTEYSFKQAYGRLPQVVERLAALGTPAAGMVEVGGGTWGHVQWEKQLTAAGIQPMFGAEFVVRMGEDRPTCWVLAEDTASLYQLTTEAFETKYYGAALTEERMAAARGLVRFAGAALSAPEAFDYVDATPASPLMQRRAAALSSHTGKPLVLVSDNAYPALADADAYKVFGRVVKVTPQHILSRAELRAAFGGLTDSEFERAVTSTFEVAERVKGVKLRHAPMIHFPGDLVELCREGIRTRAIPGWDATYEARLERELLVIAEKDFESYFLMVSDLVRWAKERMLVGPARGSAAGSLVCYLCYITEVDPMPYGLIFERFVDVTRADLPDIDLDFPDTKRDQCYKYLADKYGAAQVARIGTISSFKPKSALIEACKALGIPPHESYAVKDALFVRSSGDSRANNCLVDTMNETEPGRAFLAKFPAAVLAGDIEGHATHTGIHAAGVCVCNEPITNFCTVQEGIMHLDKYDADYVNMLKIDALGLRTLGVIEDAGVVTAQELYALPLDDPKVYALFNERRYAAIFQWEGRALQSVTNQMQLSRFSELDQITALARPGPLGAGAATRFIERHEGREGWTYPHPSLAAYLDESFGLVLYQEQVLRLCREVGDMSWSDVTLLRKAMSKSYGKEYFDQFRDKFMAGAEALHGIPARDSEPMWDSINSMGSWAFNKSHSVSYALVSYWTAWMKAYHPLEYAAAALRNSADDEAVVALLRELEKEGVKYTPFDAERSEVNWAAVNGELVGGFMNLVGFGPSKASAAVEKRRAGTLTAKDHERIAAAPVKFRQLYPLHAAYPDYYEDPESKGIRPGWKIGDIASFPEEGEVLFIAKVLEKDARDENETVRVARRAGKRVKGPSLFADISVVDDSTSTPITLRIDRFNYEPLGRLLIERLKEGEDVLLIRGTKIRNFPMVKTTKVKCLTRPELLE